MSQRSEHLMQGYLVGSLAAADVAELESWLSADARHRVRYVQAMRFHAKLRQLCGDRVASAGVDAGSARMTSAASVRLRSRRRAAPLRRWQPWVSAAAMVLLLLGGWQVFHRDAAGDGPVQVLAGQLQTSSGAPIVPGTWLLAGTQVTNTSTVTTLEWRDGSRIELSPACRVEVDENGVVLVSGRLEAAIRPHAPTQPFTIHAPHATVIVIGTRFSVSADEQRTAVAVSSGHVRVRAQHGDERWLAGGEAAVARVTGFDGRTLLVAATGVEVSGAYHSIQAAIDAARPGDTVELLPGRHLGRAGAAQDLLITGGGRADALLTLRARPGAELLSSGWNAVRLIRASWVRLEGLRLSPRDPSASGRAGNGVHMEASQHITITDCTISDFGGDGITCSTSGHVEIRANRIERCGGRAAWATGGIVLSDPQRFDATPGPVITISGNHISASRVSQPNQLGDWTGGNAITCFATTSSAAADRYRIAGNLMNGNAGSAILSFRLDHLDIEDNTCHHNGRHPQRRGAELDITTPGCRFLRNLLIPAPGHRAWTVGKTTASERVGNRVVGPAATLGERLLVNPFVVPLVDEATRQDFRLVPDLGAGARL